METDEYFGSPPKAVLLTPIIHPIKVGRCQVSQLVLVQVDRTLCPDPRNHRLGVDVKTTIVAKLYDPAYSHGAREDEGGTAVERARTHSWKEVAAYNRLLQVQGLIVPRFYGKYVYRIVSQVAEESGDVHVLLLEYSIASRYSILPSQIGWLSSQRDKKSSRKSST